MTSLQPGSALSRPSSHSPTHPDLAALAVSLQETAHALLVCAAASAPQASNAAAAPPTDAPEESMARGATSAGPAREGETRSYYFTPAAVHMERELLRKYRARDFQGLLEQAHALLVGLVRLMQSVPKEVRVRGYVISSLGTQLDHACALVLRMRHVYDNVTPVQN